MNEHAMLSILPLDPTNPKGSGPWLVRCRCGWLDGLSRQHWTQREARAAYRKHVAEARAR